MFSRCRMCGCYELETHVDFGSLHLSGKFPLPGETTQRAPLALSKCTECGLVQLRDSSSVDSLYGAGYGYESHLNKSMSLHLTNTALRLERMQNLKDTDVVLDIASNDGTLLSGYTSKGITRIGIDPTIDHLHDFYPSDCIKVSSFFSKEAYLQHTSKKAKIITSLSVFYDLNEPSRFIQDVKEVLASDGIWILEQSYLPSMLSTLSFDTICHEHLLYLTLTDIVKLSDRFELEVFDVSFSDINGGSFQVSIQHKSGPRSISPFVGWVIDWESKLESTTHLGLKKFGKLIEGYAESLQTLITTFKLKGYRVYGLGASTKGNVLLQVCNLDAKVIEAIGEINPKKYGKMTPGTSIPIVPEERIFEIEERWIALVLPWHFKNSIVSKLPNGALDKGSLLFPLPGRPDMISFK